MAVSLITVTGNLETLTGGTPFLGRLLFRFPQPDWTLSGDIFAPGDVEVVADSGGAFSIALQSTVGLQQGSTYAAILRYRDTVNGVDKELTVARFSLPAGGPYELGDLLAAGIVNPTDATTIAEWVAAAEASAAAADASADMAAASAAWVEYVATPPDGFEVTMQDSEYKGIQLDENGQTSVVVGPESLVIGHSKGSIPGVVPSGALTRVTHTGVFWQALLDGDSVIMRQYLDSVGLDPTMLDTMTFCLVLRDGQSWNTQLRYAVDLDNEDTTGATRRSVEQWRSADVCEVRADGDFTPRVPYDNRIAHMRAYSTDAASGASGDVVGLRLLRFDGTTDKGFFRIGHIASAQQQHTKRQNRAPRSGLINLTCGMAGQSEGKFLAPGTTFAGTSGTVSAEIVVGNTRTFYENDTIAINQLRAHVRAKWHQRRMNCDIQSFDQGGAGVLQSANDSNFFNFLNARRTDLDARALPTSDGGKVHMIVPQGFAASKEAFVGWQPNDQLRWAKANASGRDWLAGPFYAYKLLQESIGQSAIHGTAMHNVRKGETMGLAESYVNDPRIGSWQPLWWTNISIVGTTITITTNTPAAALSGLTIDTTTIEAAGSYGFSLRNNSGGATITLGTPVIASANTITIAITGSLAGVTAVELGYSVRGVAQADAVVGQGTHSACWGNIKMPGNHDGLFTRKPIDLWLCEFIEIITL